MVPSFFLITCSTSLWMAVCRPVASASALVSCEVLAPVACRWWSRQERLSGWTGTWRSQQHLAAEDQADLHLVVEQTHVGGADHVGERPKHLGTRHHAGSRGQRVLRRVRLGRPDEPAFLEIAPFGCRLPGCRTSGRHAATAVSWVHTTFETQRWLLAVDRQSHTVTAISERSSCWSTSRFRSPIVRRQPATAMIALAVLARLSERRRPRSAIP
jgi:hypothetical protein